MSLLISDLMALKEERDQLRAENERLKKELIDSRSLCKTLEINLRSANDQVEVLELARVAARGAADRWREDCQRLRRQCAAARECLDKAGDTYNALRKTASCHAQWSLYTQMMMDIDDALANDAGKDFVPIAQHQELEKRVAGLESDLLDRLDELEKSEARVKELEKAARALAEQLNRFVNAVDESVNRGGRFPFQGETIDIMAHSHDALTTARALGLLEKGGAK